MHLIAPFSGPDFFGTTLTTDVQPTAAGKI